ncbi:diguanylate cyclase with PAS/PAC sensor [Gallionella capsiferriformans ES-2]|jgi:diguanylate cyclase (GGDEF)-like protein/PAS domain S-box-containing protein|uniref:Diguanylate cyclase with PAS/PAC sensor n=2 Tax=Gallionella TaxID=96 RepID=D9SGC0_GALCS|nr:diguanylate cyclase with PAS/PAC sensor [Gallionella capsiferriformans ES-2]
MKPFKSSFALKLTGFMLAISVLPLLVFQLFSYGSVRHTVFDEAVRNNLLLLSNQRDYLNLQMEQINGLATNLGSVDAINQVLSASGNQSSYDLLATKARIGYVLSGYSNLKGLVSIDLFTLNGTQYHVGDTLNIDSVRSELRDQLMQKTLGATQQLMWHGVEDNVNASSSNKKVIVATKTINRADARSAEHVGMLVINFSTDYLYRHFSQLDLGKGAYLMVIDAQNRLIYHPTKNFIGQFVEKDLGNFLKGDTGSLEMRLDNRDVVFSYSHIPDKNWYVVSVVPYGTLMSSIQSVERIGIALLSLIFLLIALFIRAYLQRVVMPIRAISEGFRLFQSNGLDEHWRLGKFRTLQEISDLVNWFNSFLDMMAVHHRAQTDLRIAATAFESQEGMLITDADCVILRVNHAFSAITGYSAEEVVGKKVSILKSERHNREFYAAIWESINQNGGWQGEIWNRRKNGEMYPEWLTITAVKDNEGGVTHYVGTKTDISPRKAAEEEIRHLAFYDTLTHLPNRRLLHDRLLRTIASNHRSGNYSALMFLDMDNFKPLNDQYGHDVGDLLLIEVARRIESCIRDTDTVARFGGDEFVVMIGELVAEKTAALMQVEIVAEKIRISLAETYRLGRPVQGSENTIVEHHCSSSIGVVLFLDNSLDEILKCADIAMYRAKDAGRNMISYYDKGNENGNLIMAEPPVIGPVAAESVAG